MFTHRRRVKISVTLLPELLAVVDACVRENPGTHRSAVIDEALRLWSERQQERAMERQLREDASRSGAERAHWRRVRDPAARRRFSVKK